MRRVFVMVTALVAVLATSSFASLAQDGAAFDGGGKIDGAAGDYTFNAAPYVVTYQDQAYLYATADDGNGYYTSYDGESWASWQGWEEQPAQYQNQPAACEYNDSEYVMYNGQDGKLYYNAYDGESWAGWEEVTGD